MDSVIQVVLIDLVVSLVAVNMDYLLVVISVTYNSKLEIQRRSKKEKKKHGSKKT